MQNHTNQVINHSLASILDEWSHIKVFDRILDFGFNFAPFCKSFEIKHQYLPSFVNPIRFLSLPKILTFAAEPPLILTNNFFFRHFGET